MSFLSKKKFDKKFKFWHKNKIITYFCKKNRVRLEKTLNLSLKKKKSSFLIQMSNFEEKLNLLKKKKLTAKTIVEQQRNEIRTLKSSLTLNQRLEEIFQKLTNQNNL